MERISKIQLGDNSIQQYSSEYKIVECEFFFNRSFDCCLPKADAKCDRIELSVIAPVMSDLNLIEWFIDNSTLSGRIIMDLALDLTDNESFTQELYFENAYCTSLSENYDIDKSSKRLIKMVLIPMNVKVCDVDFPRPI